MARYSSGVTAALAFLLCIILMVSNPVKDDCTQPWERATRMASLQLSLIMGANDRSRPVLDGTVTPDGIDLTCTVAHPSEIFWRQLHFQEFDVSEMSLSSLLMAMAARQSRLGRPADLHLAPLFPHRRLGARRQRHRQARGPQGQARRRARVPADRGAVVARRAQARVRRRARGPGLVDGAHRGAQPRRRHRLHARRAGVTFNRIPADESIGTMLRRRHARRHAAVPHRQQPGRPQPRSRSKAIRSSACCSPTPIAEGQRYFDKTGIFPINHGMVVRRSIYEQHPWVALNIFNAFRLAKERGRGAHARAGVDARRAGPARTADARKALASIRIRTA